MLFSKIAKYNRKPRETQYAIEIYLQEFFVD